MKTSVFAVSLQLRVSPIAQVIVREPTLKAHEIVAKSHKLRQGSRPEWLEALNWLTNRKSYLGWVQSNNFVEP